MPITPKAKCRMCSAFTQNTKKIKIMLKTIPVKKELSKNTISVYSMHLSGGNSLPRENSRSLVVTHNRFLTVLNTGFKNISRTRHPRVK